MKTLIQLFLATLVVCSACEKDIDTFSGESGIYFETRNIFLDTIYISWGLKNSEIVEQKTRLKVCLYGNTADYDRNFKIEVITNADDEMSAVEGVDFLIADTECVMPANMAETYIDIDLLRSSNLRNQPKCFMVRLIENDELHFIYTREYSVTDVNDGIITRHLDYQRVIYMDESFPKPGWWSLYGDAIFGDWTVTKAVLICDVMGIDREDWVKTDGTLSQGYLKFVGRYMHRWLSEQTTPVLDEDGTLMKMGTMSQN